MPSLTVENYVKTIYQLAKLAGSAANGVAAVSGSVSAVATGQIAAALDVLPGTVTSMLKTLDESHLATYTPYEGVRLTPAGRALALRVLRRHRLIEQFLVQTLSLSWDEVHDEAENMEHAVSDWLVDRIDAYLGHPTTDPHGDPIPTADGTVADGADQSLAEWSAGRRFRLARVMDQSPAFLRFLSQVGLEIGSEGVLVSSEPERDSVTILVAGENRKLTGEAAGKLMVR
jgi:DtxR family transcriptional regulator, Mn-dependent transcriptional regulator